MGLGNVKGASDRAEGIIVSRSLEDVDDGVRFSYALRPALGGRIAIRDDIGDAVSVTLEGDTEPASMDLTDGTINFEVPIDAGVRDRVTLIVHDVTVEDLSHAKPTVERLETDESDADDRSGVFGRLGELLGGSGAESDADDGQEGGTADPLDVAALDALSDDVAIGDLSIAEPTVDRLETDESDGEGPSGVFGRLGELLGGPGAESAADDDQEDGTADPLDVAALEALSDDVPETPADVIEGATEGDADAPEGSDAGSTTTSDAEAASEPDADAADELDAEASGESAAADDTAEPEDGGDSANDDRSDASAASEEDTSLERAAADAVDDPDWDSSATADASATPAGGEGASADATEESDSAGESTDEAPTLGDTPGDEMDLDIPDAPEETGKAEDSPEPSVPDEDDSALVELVEELEGEDADAHRGALLEALGLSGVTAGEVEAIRERQLAIRDAVEDLRTQTRETRQTQTELTAQVEDVDDVVEAIRDEVSTLHRGCSVLEEEVTGFSNRLTALEEGIEDIDELREEVERAEVQREQLTEGIKAVDDRIDEFGEQRARLQERLDRLENTIQELEAFRSSLARAFDQTGAGGQGGTRPGGPGSR